MPALLSNCLRVFLHACLSAYLPRHAFCLPSCLCVCLSFCPSACLVVRLHTCFCACLPFCLPACLALSLPTCLPGCLFTHMLAPLPVSPPRLQLQINSLLSCQQHAGRRSPLQLSLTILSLCQVQAVSLTHYSLPSQVLRISLHCAFLSPLHSLSAFILSPLSCSAPFSIFPWQCLLLFVAFLLLPCFSSVHFCFLSLFPLVPYH